MREWVGVRWFSEWTQVRLRKERPIDLISGDCWVPVWAARTGWRGRVVGGGRGRAAFEMGSGSWLAAGQRKNEGAKARVR